MNRSGRIAVGLAFDRRAKRLFVAGGPTGEGYVYDIATGATVAVYPLTAPGSFVNDVVVTRQAAYFTDSFRPFLYRVPIGPGGSLPDSSAVEELPLGGDFQFIDDNFNANGIDATPNGESLVLVSSVLGALYRVSPHTGIATSIDLGGETLDSGDGLLLDGQTLYVVQNFLNQVAVVQLQAGFTSGVVVERLLNSQFRIPTTIGKFGSALYAVNARFDVPPEPTTEYEVVRVDLSGSSSAPSLQWRRLESEVWGDIKASR